MKNTRIAGAGAARATGLLLLAACRELIEDPSFDRWCGESLCNWELDEGRIARAQTWHSRDYAVELVEAPTQISQLSDMWQADCVRFELIADTDARAQLRLALDFNADGTVDYSRTIPGARWERLTFEVAAPAHYEKLRYILRKEGEGRAVVAQLRAKQSSGCGGPRVVLRDQLAGAACDDSEVCSFGLCTDGRCASCRVDGDCSEGELCVSGACSACSDDGDCAQGERCVWREARSRSAGRSCVPEAQQLERAVQELCDRDTDCDGTVCGLEQGAAKRCGLLCEDDAGCPDGLSCQPVVSPQGASWVSQDLCVGAVAAGAACGGHAECTSGRCCDGRCAPAGQASCD